MRPKVYAFYAFKGGTGRTLSLVQTAWHLARKGRRIAILDLDLGAPSLAGLTGHLDEPGLMEALRDARTGKEVSVEGVRPVELDALARGALYVMTAGRFDAAYLDDLEGLRWREILEPTGNAAGFFPALFERIREVFGVDAIFLDCPTGLSDTGNLCMRVLADEVIALFGLTSTQLDGIARIAHVLT